MTKVSIIFAIILLSTVIVSAKTETESKSPSQAQSGVSKTDPPAPKDRDQSQRLSYLRKASYRSEKPGVLRLGPPTTYLKNGLRTEEVIALLGQPESITTRQEGNTNLTVYVFRRSEERVLVAEFANGILVRSHVETGGNAMESETVEISDAN